jgi:hypothetical protein
MRPEAHVVRVYFRAVSVPVSTVPPRLVFVVLLSLWVAMCGQKGPLERPEPRPPAATP